MCVGNQLARGELRLALQGLTLRLKNFRYGRGDQSTIPLRGYAAHGLRTLWMEFDRR
jgi:cytochrome P450